MSNVSAVAQTKPIPFGGTITREQFSLVQRMLLPWWGSMRMTAIWIVSCVVVATIGLRGPTGSSVLVTLTSILIAAVLIVFVWRLTKMTRDRQWRQVEATQQGITGSLSDAGLEWHAAKGTAHFAWSDINKVRQHPHMLLLHCAGNAANYLPKTFFASDSEWNAANAFALRQVAGKAG
jgi:hypothetical protein